MAGKQYLLDLTADGHPVIPTVDRLADLERPAGGQQYAVKPKAGADSIGLEFVTRERLSHLTYGDVLVQPRIDFRYEVSFYFVDDAFQYALYAPDPERRWVLEPYEPTGGGSRLRPAIHRLEHHHRASSGSTPAAPRTADCCSSSWRTSTRICRWTWWPTRPVSTSSRR